MLGSHIKNTVSDGILLTDEQREIINAEPIPNGSMLVTAFAGTGKTFTLQKYAEARLKSKILYAAFNKSIQQEAEQKMPLNVSSRTTHSLAYRAFGADYRDAGMLMGGIPLWRVMKELGTNIVVADFAASVVKKFLASEDRVISEKHLTESIVNYYAKAEKIPPFVDMATRIWESMKSFRPRTLPMTHDGYLKLFQLSEPDLGFDYILLDEAQDTTPCVWDLMSKQKAKKIVVGDPHQAIYCQPVGTVVSTPSGDVRIEKLKTEDTVMTYDNGVVDTEGKKVSSVTRLFHKGVLVNVTTESGEMSRYTLKHHCLAKWDEDLPDRYTVYLMRRGDQFRVGMAPFVCNGELGFVLRGIQEGADAIWLLSVHDTLAKASLKRLIVQARHSIPNVRFSSSEAAQYWGQIGSNLSDAKRCLKEHELLLDFPIWSTENQDVSTGNKDPFVTVAANLANGMLVHVLSSEEWVPITVERKMYCGDIISIEVEDHHVYYGDGILTHNSWRGAIDAMELVTGADKYYLTQSFRFGPEVAELASTLLRRFKGERNKLRGLESLDTKVLSRLGNGEDKKTVLARSNSHIFQSSALECQFGKSSLGYVGGTHVDYRFQTYLDIYYVSIGESEKAKDPLIRSFEKYEDLVEYAGKVRHPEISTGCALVEEHGPQVPNIFKQVGERDIGAKFADVSYATGHKAKGMEFPVVEIASDFSKLIEGFLASWRRDRNEKFPDDEANLLYVAITRATKRLYIPMMIVDFIENWSGGLLEPESRARSF